MTRTILAIAALATFAATPAFAGLVDEVAQERDSQVRLVGSPQQEEKGAGPIVTSEHDGRTSPARTEGIEVVRYTRDPGERDTRGDGNR